MPSIKFDLSRLNKAQSLLISNDPYDVLITSLEGLGVELGNQVGSIGNSISLAPQVQKKIDKAIRLSEAISYASDRLTDVLTRYQLIN